MQNSYQLILSNNLLHEFVCVCGTLNVSLCLCGGKTLFMPEYVFDAAELISRLNPTLLFCLACEVFSDPYTSGLCVLQFTQRKAPQMF